VREAGHLRFGPYRRYGPTVTLSQTPGRYGTGVLAGQQTRQLLRELDYTDAQIAELADRRVIGWHEP